MPKFKVTGFAFVPVHIETVIEADTSREALEKSKTLLRGRALKAAIVPNSEDESSVCEYEPGEAHAID